MVFPVNLWVLLAVSLLVSTMGFKNYVWFISLGYGFSIAAEGLALLLLYRAALSPARVVLCLLLVVYGCRLGGYLAIRERRSRSYQTAMTGQIKDGKTIPFGVKCAIWITCAALYVTQVSGILYRLHNGGADNFWSWLGAGIMAGGLILESAADIQKNRAKAIDPHRFVDTGLFRLVRCPNYLGEMVFWTGAVVSGIGSVSGVGQWILVLVGYIGIIYVMFSGARRLELRQNRNYGSDPDYQNYVKTVPILLPFVPLYSVEKHKWLVA